MWLPVGDAAQAGIDAAVAPALVRLDVLLVDDNYDAVVTTAALLETMGHAVRVAATGEEAIGEAARQAPQVAILDIGLPDMDGYALARRLRMDDPSVRLVALSGYGQQSDVAQALEAGFALHLTKPATLEDLARALSPA